MKLKLIPLVEVKLVRLPIADWCPDDNIDQIIRFMNVRSEVYRIMGVEN